MKPGPGEIVVLIGYLPFLVRDGGISDWERRFCVSLLRAHRRGEFRPSVRQIDVLRGLVRDFRARSMREEVIE
jgi:hypothetical protein